jgi:hypothetical protein
MAQQTLVQQAMESERANLDLVSSISGFYAALSTGRSCGSKGRPGV